jgi:hypothetical protein
MNTETDGLFLGPNCSACATLIGILVQQHTNRIPNSIRDLG